jgi:hypothetical protein
MQPWIELERVVDYSDPSAGAALRLMRICDFGDA